MNHLRVGLFLGILLTLVVGALVGYCVVVNGWIPARGDVVPGELETWVAEHALDATVQREGTERSPIPADEANLMAGAKVYASNCTGCHGTPMDRLPGISKGLNPAPPLFGNGALVTDDPEGHIYWKVNHGIKFTGMPSFNSTLSKKEMWQVTLLLKHMDKLPAPVNDYWKSIK